MNPDQIITVVTSVLLALLGYLVGYISAIRREQIVKETGFEDAVPSRCLSPIGKRWQPAGAPPGG